jgi:hypothetical protein
MISEVFKAIGDMFAAVIGVLPKVIHFVLWVLSAIIILPCVFVAGNIYPAWIKWGEEF